MVPVPSGLEGIFYFVKVGPYPDKQMLTLSFPDTCASFGESLEDLKALDKDYVSSFLFGEH